MLQGWLDALLESFKKALPSRQLGALEEDNPTVTSKQRAALRMNQEAGWPF
jgi:hypothetical protein